MTTTWFALLLALQLTQTPSFAPDPPDPYVRDVIDLPAVTDLHWEIKAVADVTGDGGLYIIWRHDLTGNNVIWYLRNGVIQQAAFLPPVFDQGWEIKGATPNGIVWRHAVTGENKLWKMTHPPD